MYHNFKKMKKRRSIISRLLTSSSRNVVLASTIVERVSNSESRVRRKDTSGLRWSWKETGDGRYLVACFIYRIDRRGAKRAACHVTTKTEKGTYAAWFMGATPDGILFPFASPLLRWQPVPPFFCPPHAPLVMPRSLRAPVDFPWLINPDEISISSTLFLSLPSSQGTSKSPSRETAKTHRSLLDLRRWRIPKNRRILTP